VEAREVKRSRTLYAAGLLVGALAVLLVAWFLSGWADVRAQQREVRAAPVRAADAKAVELARELRAELARLVTRETERPYFHYQNLFHDPRTGASYAVAPSPLANGPEDPLVLGYFQREPSGTLTTPTINDDVPHLSEPKRLAEHQRFRDEVIRGFASALETHEPAVVVAEAAPVKPRPRQAPPQARAPNVAAQQVIEEPVQQKQVVQLDPQSYAQNAAPSQIYWDNYLGNPAPQQRAAPNTEQAAAPPSSPPRQRRANPPQVRAVPQAAQAPMPKPVTITISPLEWRTYDYAGAPALVAVRHVETPDGQLAQGFVIDRTTLTTWLASRAGDAVARLATGDGDGAAAIAPGWHLAVEPNPRALGAAAGAASLVARGFVLRFVIVGVIALLAAAFVVMLVARAERLARERSQFAAAAAHELRTPLAGLQLYGDMLADGLGDPGKLRDYARRMSEEASRLGRVVSNVLGFSQLERGNLSVDAKPGPLADALRELAERAQPALDRAGAVLALDVAPDLRARFDRDALARIVGNLLDNAEKYGRDARDRTIDLAAHVVGDAVEVVVSDHGPGVTAQARAKLFRPFTRGVSSDGPAGLGLGLALSRSLAQAMGGELDYRVRPGGGAAFVLRLAKA